MIQTKVMRRSNMHGNFGIVCTARIMKCANGFRREGIAVSQMLVAFFRLTGNQVSDVFRN